MAVQIADDGQVRMRHTAGGAWETYRAAPRRGWRPWVVGFRQPSGATDWIRLRGRAWREGLQDVGKDLSDPSEYVSNQGLHGDIWVLSLVYRVPVGLLAGCQAIAARGRLIRAFRRTGR